MTKTTALLALLAAAGCTYPADVQLEPGDTVAVEVLENDRAAEAVAEWNAALPALRLTMSPEGRWVVKTAELRLGRKGEFHTTRREILVSPEAVSDSVYRATLHEMGHALGVHAHLANGLMTERLHALCIDSTTVAAVCDVRPDLCDGRERPTCE